MKKIFKRKIHPRVNVLNASTSGCIGKYISLVKMYNKIRNSQIYVKIKIIVNICTLGVQVRNMKMFLKIYGTWRRVTFVKLMMKIYEIFIRLSRLVTPYNIV